MHTCIYKYNAFHLPPLSPLGILSLWYSSRTWFLLLWPCGSLSWTAACSPPGRPDRCRSGFLWHRHKVTLGSKGACGHQLCLRLTDGWWGCTGCLRAARCWGWGGTWWSWAPAWPWRSCARRLPAAGRSWWCLPGRSGYWAASGWWRGWGIW